MAVIELSKGLVTHVDDEDLPLIRQYSWHAQYSKHTKTFYARTWGDGTGKRYLLHRLLMNVEDPNIFVDHRDLNTLNNRKENLRVCSRSQNGMNRCAPSNSTTGAKGVWKRGSVYRAMIRMNGKRIHLGYFRTIEEAAKVYDDAAKKIAGEFGRQSIAIPTDLTNEFRYASIVK